MRPNVTVWVNKRSSVVRRRSRLGKRLGVRPGRTKAIKASPASIAVFRHNDSYGVPLASGPHQVWSGFQKIVSFARRHLDNSRRAADSIGIKSLLLIELGDHLRDVKNFGRRATDHDVVLCRVGKHFWSLLRALCGSRREVHQVPDGRENR